MKQENKSAFGLASLILHVGYAPLKAFTLCMLWGWFITPQFGIPVPTYATAFGLSLLLTYANPNMPTDAELLADREVSNVEKIGALIGKTYIFTIFVLGTGWIASKLV